LLRSSGRPSGRPSDSGPVGCGLRPAHPSEATGALAAM